MIPKIIRKKTQKNEIIFFDSKLKVWDLRSDRSGEIGCPWSGTVRRSQKDIKEAIESYIYNSITYQFISHKIKSGEIFYSKLALDMAKKIYFKRIKSHQNQSQVLIGSKSLNSHWPVREPIRENPSKVNIIRVWDIWFQYRQKYFGTNLNRI